MSEAKEDDEVTLLPIPPSPWWEALRINVAYNRKLMIRAIFGDDE